MFGTQLANWLIIALWWANNIIWGLALFDGFGFQTSLHSRGGNWEHIKHLHAEPCHVSTRSESPRGAQESVKKLCVVQPLVSVASLHWAPSKEAPIPCMKEDIVPLMSTVQTYGVGWVLRWISIGHDYLDLRSTKSHCNVLILTYNPNSLASIAMPYV